MTYLGAREYCDDCGHDAPARPCWTEGASKLCKECYTRRTGSAPPRPLAAAEQPSPPAAPPPAPVQSEWVRLAPGLRARALDGGGLQVQAVHAVVLDGHPHAVSDGTWDLSPEALIDAFLHASPYHHASVADRALARLQLSRILTGKEHP